MTRYRIVVILFLIMAVIVAVSNVTDHASAKDKTPRGEPATTTPVPSSWPKPQIHTITKNNNGEGYTPNNVSYWWHGTIDGRECILVEDSDHPALSCDWGHTQK